jgi:DNA-binding MarR family transcriptional regulator
MEVKGVDFTRRLVERRLEHFELNLQRYLDPRASSAVWMALFQASLGNPRTLGYILFFAYESQLLYGRPISVSGVRDAAKRYYEDKLEPYFAMGRFLHESFEEKSTIFSLKELLERIVSRARFLRSKETASIFRKIEGQHPTSHFNTSQAFDSILSTLELNFFVTKYYVMSNRDGHRVSVYALNYGLCEKYSIAFGRPRETREQRLYFVERVFDYNSLIQDYIASNQEIMCDNCSEVFEPEDLDALKRFNMLCPACRTGTCRVTNISRKYEEVIRSVNADQLLPATELGILQTLNSESEPLFAGDIAGELDVSYQLIGKRAKRLDERDLVDRAMVRGRREYQLSEAARRIYFDSGERSVLQLSVAEQEDQHAD